MNKLSTSRAGHKYRNCHHPAISQQPPDRDRRPYPRHEQDDRYEPGRGEPHEDRRDDDDLATQSWALDAGRVLQVSRRRCPRTTMLRDQSAAKAEISMPLGWMVPAK